MSLFRPAPPQLMLIGIRPAISFWHSVPVPIQIPRGIAGLISWSSLRCDSGELIIFSILECHLAARINTIRLKAFEVLFRVTGKPA
jgi:hypothetical protein